MGLILICEGAGFAVLEYARVRHAHSMCADTVASNLQYDERTTDMKKLIPLVAGIASLLCVSLASAEMAGTGTGTGNGPDMALVTGEHWSQSTDELRKAYLYGIGNILEMEQAMHDDAVSSKNSMVPVLIKALSPMTLDQVKDSLTNWYASHPDQAKRPVVEVLYVEIAQPRL